jgi:hypothetical protein
MGITLIRPFLANVARVMVAAVVIAPLSSWCQTPNPSTFRGGAPRASLPRFVVEFDSGFHYFPGMLLGQADIVRHPDHLSGYDVTSKVGTRLPHGMSLHAGLFRSSLSGNGAWERGNLASMGYSAMDVVSGAAIGVTHMTITGGTFSLRKTFKEGKSTRIFVEGGAGPGVLKVRFDGMFEGQDWDGNQFSIPASDRIRELVPLITGSVGARRTVGHIGEVTVSYSWNTGHIVSIGTRFNPKKITSFF